MTLLGSTAPVIVTIETPDGRVIRSSGLVVNIEFTQMGDAQSCRLEAILTSPMMLSQTGLRERVRKSRSDTEWMCEYCRTPNKRADTTCTQCAGARSFVYD